jgi:hypothetical protein
MASVGPREIETTVGGTVSAEGSVGTGILIAKGKGTDGEIGKGSESGIEIEIGIGEGRGAMDRSGIMAAMNGMPRDQTAQAAHQVEINPPKPLPI